MYAALVIVMNEIDKMSRRKSDEADFAMLMEERAKGFCRSKIFRMSTPGYKGRSRVEAARLAGDNRARWCPCPFCNGWQLLKLGNGREPGGIRWDKLAGGRSDPAKALVTAWYECELCQRKIGNEHRHQLLNDARWVKAGQTIHGSGTIKGQPLYTGPDASFGPLSTLYSLLPSITWGVNTERTQQWIQKILDGVEPADGPYGLTLPDEARMDLDFVDQLLNEFMIDERNENGYTVHSWKKRGKNELRDAPRYARAAAMLLTKEGKNWDKLPPRQPAPAPPPPARESPRGRLTTPDGRPFLATER